MSLTTTTYLWVDWTLNWQAQNASRLTGTRNQTISVLLVLWICNTGRYINHFVNHHRWWIGESWINIYVGCKNIFPLGGFLGFMETLVGKKFSTYWDWSLQELCMPFHRVRFEKYIPKSSWENETQALKSIMVTTVLYGSCTQEWWLLLNPLQHSRDTGVNTTVQMLVLCYHGNLCAEIHCCSTQWCTSLLPEVSLEIFKSGFKDNCIKMSFPSSRSVSQFVNHSSMNHRIKAKLLLDTCWNVLMQNTDPCVNWKLLWNKVSGK